MAIRARGDGAFRDEGGRSGFAGAEAAGRAGAGRDAPRGDAADSVRAGASRTDCAGSRAFFGFAA